MGLMRFVTILYFQTLKNAVIKLAAALTGFACGGIFRSYSVLFPKPGQMILGIYRIDTQIIQNRLGVLAGFLAADGTAWTTADFGRI